MIVNLPNCLAAGLVPSKTLQRLDHLGGQSRAVGVSRVDLRKMTHDLFQDSKTHSRPLRVEDRKWVETVVLRCCEQRLCLLDRIVDNVALGQLPETSTSLRLIDYILVVQMLSA